MVSKSKKTVRFGETTTNTIDYGDIDRSLWYHESELRNNQKEEIRLAQGILDDEDDDDSIACWRGLEPYQEGLDHYRIRRRNFVFALLNVQDELRGMDVNDPKGLQAFASAHSRKDCRQARKRGQEDEAYVCPVAKGKSSSSFVEGATLNRLLPQIDVFVSARTA